MKTVHISYEFYITQTLNSHISFLWLSISCKFNFLSSAVMLTMSTVFWRCSRATACTADRIRCVLYIYYYMHSTVSNIIKFLAVHPADVWTIKNDQSLTGRQVIFVLDMNNKSNEGEELKGELSLHSAAPLSSAEQFSIFQFIVLDLWPAILLFWPTLSVLINLVSWISMELFKSPDKPYAACSVSS